MHDHNVLIRKLHVRIDGLERRVVPLLDFSQIDVGQQQPGKLNGLFHAGQVVYGDNSAHHEGYVHDVAALFTRRLELVVSHGRVSATKVQRLVGHLPDAAARANGRVVDFDALLFVVDAGPFAHHGINKARAAPVQPPGGGSRTTARSAARSAAGYGKRDGGDQRSADEC